MPSFARAPRRLLQASALACTITLAASSELVVQDTLIPVMIGGAAYRLEALVVKQAVRQGRLPLAVIAHGSPGTASLARLANARHMLPQAHDLARRGWLVVAALRRGFGQSEGHGPTFFARCDPTNVAKLLEEGADDLEALVQELRRRPDVDPDRIIGIGNSIGGMVQLGFAARRPSGLTAVVNVSGGLSWGGSERGCDPHPDLVAYVRNLGVHSSVPTLWLYAWNDSLFSPSFARQLHRSDTEAGGRAELRFTDALRGREGHALFSDTVGRDVWLGELDGFLDVHAPMNQQTPSSAALASLEDCDCRPGG